MPPLLSDIDLSLDDRFLYASAWGTGEMRQYDASDPMAPKLAGSVHFGGITRKTPHPGGGDNRGGPQMVEISRDGKRSTGPTRSTRLGTTSSIRTAFLPRW